MSTLAVDFVVDFVCPWCFLGHHRLKAALAALQQDQPGLRVQTHWLPFFLNPDTPSQGEPYRPFLEAKFGGARQVDALFDQLRSAAAEDGLTFNFEGIQLRANTLRAHRLIYMAQSGGESPARIAALGDALFRAYFCEGRDIGDVETLIDLAADAGISRTGAAALLASDKGSNEVRKMAENVRRMGIDSVPATLLQRSLLVSGAQSVSAIGAACLQALAPQTRQ